jgi:hypothetical protein
MRTRKEIDMYCENCGKQIKKGAAFCGQCGHKIAQGDEQAPPKRKAERDKRMAFVILAAIVLGVIGIGIGIYALASSGKPDTKPQIVYVEAPGPAVQTQVTNLTELIAEGCDYANVRWLMTNQTVWGDLGASGRKNIQKHTGDTSMWFAGTEAAISAQFTWQGLEIHELYLFKGDSLVCMGFDAPFSAKEKIVQTLEKHYGRLIPKATNIERRELLNLTNYGYVREFGIQSSRTAGTVHTKQNSIIDVTLIPDWENDPPPVSNP